MDVQHVLNICFYRDNLIILYFPMFSMPLRLPTAIHIHNNQDMGAMPKSTQ